MSLPVCWCLLSADATVVFAVLTRGEAVSWKSEAYSAAFLFPDTHDLSLSLKQPHVELTSEDQLLHFSGRPWCCWAALAKNEPHLSSLLPAKVGWPLPWSPLPHNFLTGHRAAYHSTFCMKHFLAPYHTQSLSITQLIFTSFPPHSEMQCSECYIHGFGADCLDWILTPILPSCVTSNKLLNLSVLFFQTSL